VPGLADTGDVAAGFLMSSANLQFVKLGGDPEIGKEQDHQAVRVSKERGASRSMQFVKDLHIEVRAKKIRIIAGNMRMAEAKMTRHDTE